MPRHRKRCYKKAIIPQNDAITLKNDIIISEYDFIEPLHYITDFSLISSNRYVTATFRKGEEVFSYKISFAVP